MSQWLRSLKRTVSAKVNEVRDTNKKNTGRTARKISMVGVLTGAKLNPDWVS